MKKLREPFRVVVWRLWCEARFFWNTIKESMVHPFSTSYIDKRTGKLVSRGGREPHKNNAPTK